MLIKPMTLRSDQIGRFHPNIIFGVQYTQLNWCREDVCCFPSVTDRTKRNLKLLLKSPWTARAIEGLR